MPQFCIGLAATSIGDFGSTPGPLDVPRGIAEGLAQAALDAGIDLAVSLRMEVDHGTVQPLEILFGGLTKVPVVPFFINSVALPFTPVHRVRALGEAPAGTCPAWTSGSCSSGPADCPTSRRCRSWTPHPRISSRG
jgi:Catalytic LigB subunit of aromatic ring-opening dioxygenase.